MTQHEHASKSQDAAHSARRQVTPERTAAKDAEKPLAEHIAASPIQAKLAVSSPVDASEREADLMAATVMRRIEVEIQRQEEEEVQTKLARQEEEEEVQMKAGTSPGIVADGLEARINTARGSGSAIEPGVKSELEPAFGYDFSGVRVHTGGEADHLSRELAAEAFTVGNDIFFRDNAYQPRTSGGKHLLAHELTHVVQQAAAPELRRVTTKNSAGATQTTQDGAAGATQTTQPASEALKALWDSIVISSVQQAYTVFTGGGNLKTRASQASELLKKAADTVHTVRQSYRENPETFGMMNWAHSRLETIRVGLGSYSGNNMSVEELSGLLNPAGNTFQIFGQIKERL